MMMTKTYYLRRGDDDEIELEVEFSATPLIPATWGQPAEGGEVEVETITGPDGEDFAVTDDEREAIETHMAENLSYSDFDDEPDYD